jgi:hypothetical protein
MRPLVRGVPCLACRPGLDPTRPELVTSANRGIFPLQFVINKYLPLVNNTRASICDTRAKRGDRPAACNPTHDADYLLDSVLEHPLGDHLSS